MSRVRYTRDELKAIEAVVAENPKKWIAKPQPKPEEPRRARFERPAGYQGRVGRDRDAETFEEGFQYELEQRTKGDSGLPQATLPPPDATGMPSTSAGHHSTGRPADDDDFLTQPITAGRTQRKSRFNFDNSQQSTQPAASHTSSAPQPAAAQPPSAPVQQQAQVQGHALQAFMAQQQQFQQQAHRPSGSPQHPVPSQVAMPSGHHAMPVGTTGFAQNPYMFQVSAGQQPQQQQTVGHAMPVGVQQPMTFGVQPGTAATQAFGQPAAPAQQPAAQRQSDPGSFTVTASNTAANVPTTRSGDMDVAAMLARQGVSQQHGRNNHSAGRLQQQAPAMPPDPAIVSIASQKQPQHQPAQQPNARGGTGAPPPALQALFSGVGAQQSKGSAPRGAVDAAALEASLQQSAGTTERQDRHGRDGGDRRGGRGHRRGGEGRQDRGGQRPTDQSHRGGSSAGSNAAPQSQGGNQGGNQGANDGQGGRNRRRR